MKRRVALAALTFAILLLAYGVYRQASRGTEPVAWQFTSRPAGLARQATTIPGQKMEVLHPDSAPAYPPQLLYYDKQHNLRAKYEADRWEKDGEFFHILKPHVEWYLKGGQKVTLTAETGLAKPKEVGGEWAFRSGRLENNVWIVMDRNTDPRRGELANRPEDEVRIHVDYIEFDQDRLMIQTNSRVEMHAHEADTFGTGLWISWSEAPLALRELRIEKGEKMVIREGQDKFMRDMSLPGSDTVAVASTDSAPVEAARPSRKASAATRAAQPVPVASAPATGPSAKDGLRIVENMYTVEFIGQVEVNNNQKTGKQYLHGADVLQLTFDVRQNQKQRRNATTAASQSVSRPPTSQPAAEPMLVTWTGPLVLRPLHGDETPLARRLDVAARGEAMEMTDGRATARCQAFEFHSPQEHGLLIGSDDAPARLEIAQIDPAHPEEVRPPQYFVAPRLRFQRDESKNEILVNLDGKGEMYLPERPQSAKAADTATTRSKNRDYQGQETRIHWSKAVTARFGQRDGRKGGSTKREDYLREADFNGDVDVKVGTSQTLKAQKELKVTFNEPASPAEPANQLARLFAEGDVDFADSETGDFVKGQQVEVEMSTEPGQKNQPRLAKASGNVSARQDNRDIAGERVEITFKAQRDEKTGQMKSKPDVLNAYENVRVDDHSGTDHLMAEADTLEANLQDKSVTLTGNPAKVTQSYRQIEGDKIIVDGKDETANVPGKGALSMFSDTDLSGNKLKNARRVDVNWSQSLVYNGKEHNAIIEGNVDLRTEDDRLRCDTTTILFSAAEATTKKAPASPSTRATSKPTSKPTSRKSSTSNELANISPQRISMVWAKGKKVVLDRQRMDADGFLLQRMQLQTSNQLVYQAELRKVTCDEPGYMVMEDYRPPDAAAKPAQSSDGTVMPSNFTVRPAQSAFQWEKSMSMQQDNGGTIVTLQGNVRMGQCTGSEMKFKDSSNIRLPEKLPAGEFMLLNCDFLLAKFAPLSKEEAAKAADDSGLKAGALELLDARGYDNVVSFEDKSRKLSVGAKGVLFQRAMNVAIIVGSLPNQPARLAQVSYVDPKTGALQNVTAPRILWNPPDPKKPDDGIGKITIDKMEARGGRY